MKYALPIFAVFLLMTPSAHAARLFFTEPQALVRAGDTFPLTLMLDTQGADVNAVDGVVIVSDSLAIAGIRETDSIVPLWVTRPTIEGGRSSTFSGVIPGGFTGLLSPFWQGDHPGVLYTLVLEAKRPGTARVSVGPGVSVLANDGSGTELPVTADDAVLTIGTGGGTNTSSAPAVDTVPPEPFTPLLGQSPEIFGGKYFLAFSATDSDSGIDHYEVAETRLPIPPAPSSYVRAESPYLIKDQGLGSYIYVKAVDRDGNETIAQFMPHTASLWHRYRWLLIPIALLLVYGAYTLIRSRRRHELSA